MRTSELKKYHKLQRKYQELRLLLNRPSWSKWGSKPEEFMAKNCPHIYADLKKRQKNELL